MNALAAVLGLFSIVIGVVASIFIISAISSIINGFVLSKLWLWFIVPFFGFAPLSIPLAIGISLIVTFLTYHTIGLKAEDDAAKKRGNAVLVFVRPFVYLLFGWVVHSFFMPENITPMFNTKAPIVQTVVAPVVAPVAAPVAPVAVEATK